MGSAEEVELSTESSFCKVEYYNTELASSRANLCLGSKAFRES